MAYKLLGLGYLLSVVLLLIDRDRVVLTQLNLLGCLFML